jgi:putative endonuclease
MPSFVYIMASGPNGTLYTGVTTDLARRVWEHRDRVTGGFTSRHGVRLLVWYREYENVIDAIADEKRIKRWRRAWKIGMIEETNPLWEDLYPGLR